MIGASAAISGAMAAAMRFAFQPCGPLGLLGGEDEAYRVPALPLTAVLRDRAIAGVPRRLVRRQCAVRARPLSDAGGEQAVAWQAHIGGFLAGLIAFAVFDPVPRSDGATTDEERSDLAND